MGKPSGRSMPLLALRQLTGGADGVMDGPVRLAPLLDDACARHPDKIAIASGDRRLSFAGLRERAAHCAALADAGLAGERVATLLPNSPELIVCYLGCWAAGTIAVPFEYVDAPPEIRYGLKTAGALADRARGEARRRRTGGSRPDRRRDGVRRRGSARATASLRGAARDPAAPLPSTSPDTRPSSSTPPARPRCPRA